MTAVQTSRWIAAQATALAMVLLAALIAALTLQSPASPADTLRLVGAASQAAAEAGSYRMDMEFSVEASGFQIDLEGFAEIAADGDARGEMSLPVGGTMRFLATAGRGWFELPEGSAMRLGGKKWVGFPMPEGSLPVTENPLEMLQLLSGDSEVVDLGRGEVNGVDVQHYRAELDPAALADLAEQQQDNPMIGDAIRQVDGPGRLDLWLDDDDLPRRMRTVFEMQEMTIVFAFDLSDYGLDVDVTPPPADEVLDVESQQAAGGFLTG